MVFTSYAKLNLFLAVLDKRRDSYHNLDTLFERIDLCDSISLTSRQDADIRIITNSDKIPVDSANLAWRAARLMQQAGQKAAPGSPINRGAGQKAAPGSPINRGVTIRITKRIPVGSGMAGGSSNAATVLLGLNKVWRLALSRGRLTALARRLGADVAFFVYQVPFARGLGRGDRIKPISRLNDIRLWHVIVVPDFGVSTAEAYKKWDEIADKVELTMPETSVKLITSVLNKKASWRLPGALYNSLEDASIRLYPKIRQVKVALARAGVKSILMSGSGPAVFGIVPSRKEALSVRRKLRTRNKGWQVFVARTI